MSFVQIEAVRVGSVGAESLGIAFVNPEQVVAVAQPLDNKMKLTAIIFATASAENSKQEVSMWTESSLESVLQKLGPFFEVKREGTTGDNWPVWYVRRASIRALTPIGDGGGNLSLSDGTVMRVNYSTLAHRFAGA